MESCDSLRRRGWSKQTDKLLRKRVKVLNNEPKLLVPSSLVNIIRKSKSPSEVRALTVKVYGLDA